jgi:hypothetical protein
MLNELGRRSRDSSYEWIAVVRLSFWICSFLFRLFFLLSIEKRKFIWATKEDQN